MKNRPTRKLSELSPGETGWIVSVLESGKTEESSVFVRRLLEMGFLEGSHLEVVHEAPFGGNPIAVRIRGALIALRREDASAIEVQLESEAAS